jgi:hypothetical protein
MSLAPPLLCSCGDLLVVYAMMSEASELRGEA